MSYKGVWGYHPLLLTLANTGEVLRLLNRSGNRPSHEGAAAALDECIDLCRGAGFRKIVLRGDTDFSQTQHLDRWHAQGDVQFVFGLDANPSKDVAADDLPDSAWKLLDRPPKYVVQTKTRTRPEKVKQQVVDRRGYKDVRLEKEWVASMPYRPAACRTTYRLVIVRKDLQVRQKDQKQFFPDYRYFYYLTNDEESTAEQIVFSANDRCQQENLIAQLGASRALHAPVDNLLSNEAYMLITSLAWNLKAWLALSTPVQPGSQRENHQMQKQQLLSMEFRTFVNSFLRIPAQVLRSGRRTIVRLLAWNVWQPVFFRLAAQLAYPRRC